MTTPRPITVRATVARSAAQAWDAYTDPDAITQWNFASDDWHCPSATNDLRVGGTLKSRMEARDGSQGFDFEATYTEVTPYKRIGYQLGPDRVVTVEFNERAGSTEVAVTFTPETTFPTEYQKSGWQAILDNYKKFAER